MPPLRDNRWIRAAALWFGMCLFLVGAVRTTLAQDEGAPATAGAKPKFQTLQPDPNQPQYKVDASWPQELPNHWIYGAIGGMAVDSQNHIWVLQRPKTLNATEIGEAPSSPRHAMCCLPAPPVLEFDTEGKLLKSWGGPAKGYDWPTSEHGIYVEANGDVWIGGNGGPMDRQVLKFTNDGKFLLEIGHPSNSKVDSNDTSILGYPAGLEVDDQAHELYIADGYLNRRVIVFDSNTGKFKRMWGAYGNAPNDSVPVKYDPNGPGPQQFGGPVHCVHLSNDGFVYVCDRNNDRMQIFTKQGKFVKEYFIRGALNNGVVCDLTFTRDPEQKYILVADNSDNVIWTVRRSDGAVVGMMGHDGRQAGQFHAIHQLVSDSFGNLYTGEVEDGKRIQKFTLAK